MSSSSYSFLREMVKSSISAPVPLTGHFAIYHPPSPSESAAIASLKFQARCVEHPDTPPVGGDHDHLLAGVVDEVRDLGGLCALRFVQVV